MRSVALAIVVFLLLAAGLGMIEAGAPNHLGPLSEPRNLQATPGVLQVGLTWQVPTANGGYPITNYKIYRGTATGTAAFLTDAGNVLTHTDMGLMSGVTYYYQVSAQNSIGLVGPRSNEASATPTAPTVPSAPRSLVATDGVLRVDLAWLAPSSDGGSPITNYNVSRGTAPAPAPKILLASVGTLRTYTDTTVMAGQAYYYQVTAENFIGEGLPSNEAVVMPEVEILILAPGAGQTISTLGFRLQVSVTNFTLDPASINQTDNPGHGHYHVWVNDTFTGVKSGDPIMDLSNFLVGPMKLGVELVTNMHASLSPAVWHNITVTVVAPSIALTHPADGGTVGTQGPRFQVDVQGLELDSENLGGNPIPAHGHYHVWVDGSFTGITPTEPTFTIPSFTAGSHTVKVDLRTNSHQLLSPTVEDTITVTAVDPSISIVEPTASATVGTLVFLQVQIAGFIIDAENVGQANVPGRGHYHVTVDGATIDFMVTGLTYAVKDLAEGDHTLAVSLHNNDHSALSPAVTDQVTVTVEMAAPPPPPPAAGIDPVVFAGTSIGLVVLLIVVAVALILWGRRGRQAP